MIDEKRRILLKGSLAAGSVGMAIGAGLLSPRLVLAQWNQSAFEANDAASAIAALMGGGAEQSDAIEIKAPDIAENGAVVPVTVETGLSGVKSIAIVATGNVAPLIASFDLGEAALPFVSTRIKMAKTADVVAYVKTADKVLSNARNVKVTIGGCGG
jgi:sulfur-oxidizing protein SoxY